MPDLTPFLRLIVFIHVAAAFAFAAGHGVSMLVAFRLRAERDPVRIATLLDLSGQSLALAGIGLLVMLVAGILAGIVGGSFGRGWTWAALVLLIVIGGLMTPLGAGHFNEVRRAVGMPTPGMKPEDPNPVPLSPEQVAAITASRRPEALALIGAGGFLVILWLMMAKPF